MGFLKNDSARTCNRHPTIIGKIWGRIKEWAENG
jgi:hypothetical protein